MTNFGYNSSIQSPDQESSLPQNIDTQQFPKEQKSNQRKVIIIKENSSLYKPTDRTVKKEPQRSPSISLSIDENDSSFEEEQTQKKPKPSVFDWNEWEKRCARVNAFARFTELSRQSNLNGALE